MKRRKRKRDSKAASPPTPKIPSDAEMPAEPSAALAGADHQTPPRDEFIAPVEVEKPANDPTALAGADYMIDLGDEFIAAVEKEEAARDSVTLDEADYHTPPRDEFTAAVEVVAAESGARIETRVRDLSQQGCYVDTNSALPLGTVTDIRITKGAQLFEAHGRVVYSRASKGMGLVFTDI